MRRTIDLALARARLGRGRWPGLSSESESPGCAEPADRDGRAPAAAAEPATSTAAPWPPGGTWVRLVAILVVLVLVGAGGALAVAWPRSTGEVLAVAAHGGHPGGGNGSTASAAPPPDGPAVPQGAPEPVVPLAPREWVLVHVTGAVRRPGVVRLPAGSRVQDAVEAAGGVPRRRGVGATNLARRLVDGERLDVGQPGPQLDPPVGQGGAPDPAPIDLNAATAPQLEQLPGIGPVTAGRILSWRSANGRFTIVDELLEVPGIGPKTLAQLRPRVRV